MLNESDVVANVAVKDLAAAKKFYTETLGLEIIHDGEFGTTFKSGATRLFVYPTPNAGTAKSTVANWDVKDIKSIVKQLDGKVEFERYEYPGAEHDGPIHILGGIKSMWFKDPDGNVLGVMEADAEG
jgi:catechol 2,3-dioxygenase-like lactoylglutathione lyase family enzyme